MPSVPPLRIRAANPYDIDAFAYFNAIVANGGTIGNSAKNAVNTFIKGLKTDGSWSLIYEIGLFVGVDQLAAALVKVKTPLASRILTNVNFASSDYVATGTTAGLKGDGTSKVLDTGFNLSSTGTNPQSCSLTNLGLFAYWRGTEASGTIRWVMGSNTSGASLSGIGWVASGSKDSAFIGGASGAEYPQGSASSIDGFVGVSCNGSRAQQPYRNGSTMGASLVSTSGLSSNTIAIAAAGNGSPYGSYSTRYIRGYAITQGFSSAQVTSFSSRWNTLMTAFSANTY